MAAIEIRGLTKEYDGRRALDAIDLDVEEGEIVALLGPNGAGKTTTVEICEGFRARTAGTVRVLGADPADDDPRRRDRIGIVAQGSGGLDLLTPREILCSTAKAYARPRAVEDVIDAVGLAAKADARIGSLSGGQRRRLDVGLGIVGDPELLFLDEPTTGFDPAARRDFWGLVRGLADGGTTILLTTHYLDEAEHLADRLAVIAAGRILEVSTPERLGGRAETLATVRWHEGGGHREESTASPTALVAELSARLGSEIPGLQVTRPTLEDVYLALLGEDGPGAVPATEEVA